MAEQLSLLTTSLSFALVGGLLAMSTYVVLRVGLLSFATVTFAAIGAPTPRPTPATEWAVGLPVAVGDRDRGRGPSPACWSHPWPLRLETHWLALATVALMLVTRVVVVNLPGVTGGSQGEVVPFAPRLPAVLIVVIVVSVVVARFVRTRFGAAGSAASRGPRRRRDARDPGATRLRLGVRPQRGDRRARRRPAGRAAAVHRSEHVLPRGRDRGPGERRARGHLPLGPARSSARWSSRAFPTTSPSGWERARPSPAASCCWS